MISSTFLRLVLLLLTLSLLSAESIAAPRQNLTTIERTAERFLAAQLAADAKGASYDMGHLDSNLFLPACKQLEAYLPAGAQLTGRSSIGVRCLDAAGWSINVPVTILQSFNVVVLTRPMRAGQVIATDDVRLRKTDVAPTSNSILTGVDQAIGKTTVSGLAAGLVLRAEMLRAPLVIQANQSVQVRVAGEGFQVETEGRALGNAAAGQVVTVRTASGQVLQGIAQSPGVVVVGQ